VNAHRHTGGRPSSQSLPLSLSPLLALSFAFAAPLSRPLSGPLSRPLSIFLSSRYPALSVSHLGCFGASQHDLREQRPQHQHACRATRHTPYAIRHITVYHGMSRCQGSGAAGCGNAMQCISVRPTPHREEGRREEGRGAKCIKRCERRGKRHQCASSAAHLARPPRPASLSSLSRPLSSSLSGLSRPLSSSLSSLSRPLSGSLPI